jgi:hypothetical protein
MPQPELEPIAPYRFAMEIGDPADPARTPRRARLELEPGNIEQGLLKLVLSVAELIRQLMEKQAMRRIEAGTLTLDETERLGCGLMEIETKIRELQTQFGIDDLNIDLGPVGQLLDQAQ